MTYMFAVAISPVAWLIFGLVAVLLFGNRLPSVMRSLGRSVVEFKKGVAGIEDDLDEAVRSSDEQTKKKKAESDSTSEA